MADFLNIDCGEGHHRGLPPTIALGAEDGHAMDFHT